jgi:tetratricopeptide (TPR) repeat protein
MKPARFIRLLGAGTASSLLLALASASQAQAPACGTLENHYGPFDYRTQRDKLEIVERYHFTPSVESLRAGASTTRLGGDISYLLATSPNHHRGLLAMMRLADREKSPHPKNMRYSVDCYFDRAIRFQRNDTTVRMLYAQYLQKQKRTPEALAQLQVASDIAKDNGFTNYNIGLVYFEMGQYDLALAQAHKAKALGFDQPELAQMLAAKNKWKEPAN